MEINKWIRLLVLGVFASVVASCGDEVYYTMENSSKKLCAKTWVYDYENENGQSCTYQLDFEEKDKKGYELTVTYDEDGRVMIEREFSWMWADDSKEGISMVFNNETKMLENVWVRENYLSCFLEGENITFVGEDK